MYLFGYFTNLAKGGERYTRPKVRIIRTKEFFLLLAPTGLRDRPQMTGDDMPISANGLKVSCSGTAMPG